MRKGEQTAKRNEHDYPHIVEIVVPEFGFGRRLDDMSLAHRKLGIEQHRGGGRRDSEGHFYARWCFADREHAGSFARAFGGSVVRE